MYLHPIGIDIVTADQATLRLECARLGIRVAETATAAQLRIALRQYAKRQKAWDYERGKWCEHARLLKLPLPANATPEQAMAVVCNFLYDTLEGAGYIGVGQGGRRKRLYHPLDNEPFYVIGRLEGEWVSTACPDTCKGKKHAGHGDKCAVWFAAECAFPDMQWVNLGVRQWEADRNYGRDGSQSGAS